MYIGSNDRLDIINQDGFVYDFMAGGGFDATYAGGYAYNSLNLPSPDLRSFFINQTFLFSASLLELNEDFCEFVLLPMHIMIFHRKKEMNIREIAGVVKQLNKMRHRIQSNKESQRIKESFKGGKGGFDGSAFLREMVQDSFMEDRFEELGNALGGVGGRIVAGLLYDAFSTGKINEANIAEALYGEFKGLMIKKATGAIAQAFGSSLGIVGSYAIGMAVSAIINELFEVVTGQDRSFGFGGDIVGFMRGVAVYQEDLGFFSGVKNLFGGLDFYRVVDYSGNIMGYVDSSGMYEYKSYPSIKSVMLGEKFGRLEAEKVGEFKGLEREIGGYNSKFGWSYKTDRFGDMSFGLGMRRDNEVGYVGNFKGVLDDIAKENIFGKDFNLGSEKERDSGGFDAIGRSSGDFGGVHDW